MHSSSSLNVCINFMTNQVADVVREELRQETSPEMDETAFGQYESSAVPDEDETVVDSVSGSKHKDMRRTRSVGSISPDTPVMVPMSLQGGLPFQQMTGQFPATSFFPNIGMFATPQDVMSVMSPNLHHDMTVQFMAPMMRQQQQQQQQRRGRGGRVNDSRDR